MYYIFLWCLVGPIGLGFDGCSRGPVRCCCLGLIMKYLVRVVCVNFVLICGERLGDEELSRGNGDESVEEERSRWRFREDIDKTGLECLSFLGVVGSEA